MGKHFSTEFKEQVVNDYKSGKYGGCTSLAKYYGLAESTVKKWIMKDRIQGNQINDSEKKRGRPKKQEINYKERYEILKNYQAFIKAQREKK